MKTKFTLLPRRESNPQAKVFTPSPQPKLLLLPVSPHGKPYHYHAQRIFCAIKLNYVTYQAATDRRAFQLIPLSLSL